MLVLEREIERFINSSESGSYVTSDSESDFGECKLQNSNSDTYRLSTHELFIHSDEIIEWKEFVSTEKDVSNHIFDIH